MANTFRYTAYLGLSYTIFNALCWDLREMIWAAIVTYLLFFIAHLLEEKEAKFKVKVVEVEEGLHHEIE